MGPAGTTPSGPGEPVRASVQRQPLPALPAGNRGGHVACGLRHAEWPEFVPQSAPEPPAVAGGKRRPWPLACNGPDNRRLGLPGRSALRSGGATPPQRAWPGVQETQPYNPAGPSWTLTGRDPDARSADHPIFKPRGASRNPSGAAQAPLDRRRRPSALRPLRRRFSGCVSPLPADRRTGQPARLATLTGLPESGCSARGRFFSLRLREEDQTARGSFFFGPGWSPGQRTIRSRPAAASVRESSGYGKPSSSRNRAASSGGVGLM